MLSTKRRRKNSRPEIISDKPFFLDINIDIIESKGFLIEKSDNCCRLELTSKNQKELMFLPMIVEFFHTLSEDTEKACMEIFTKNMKTLYEKCSWGLDLDKKLEELRHKQAKFLTVTTSNGDVAAFCHFRFEEKQVLYIWELQVCSEYQGLGLGSLIISTLELVASSLGNMTLMLTVFTNNSNARKFYERIGFKTDKDSPSDADYEILFKCPVRKSKRSRKL